jgi:hypothetical protein
MASNDGDRLETATGSGTEKQVARIDPAVVEPEGQKATDEELYQQLAAEVDELEQRIEVLAPDYEPPPFSPKGLVALIERMLSRYPRDVQLRILEQLRSALRQDLFRADLWRGVWYMLNYTLQYNVDLVRRRYTGQFDTDEWGLGEGQIVVDESMLTGDSRQHTRRAGEPVYAGSFCFAGHGAYEARKVGDERLITALTGEFQAAEEELTPLERTMDRLLRILLLVVAILSLLLLADYFAL